MNLWHSKYLKSTYSRTARAKRALTNVMRSGDIGDYKKLFENAVDRTMGLPMLPTLNTSSSDTFRAENNKRASKVAQSLTKHGYRGRCESCGVDRTTEKLMFCPCQNVEYCSKLCQQNHWKYHKQNCSWFLSKKAKDAE